MWIGTLCTVKRHLYAQRQSYTRLNNSLSFGQTARHAVGLAPKSYLNRITAPAHPYAIDAVIDTALFSCDPIHPVSQCTTIDGFVDAVVFIFSMAQCRSRGFVLPITRRLPQAEVVLRPRRRGEHGLFRRRHLRHFLSSLAHPRSLGRNSSHRGKEF